MNGRDLLDAMEYISDDLIEEAATEGAQKKYGRNFTIRKWVATAAGIAVLCVSAFVLNEWKHATFNNNSSSSDTSGANDMNFSATAENDSGKEEKAQEDNMAAAGIDQSASLDTQTAYDMNKQDSIQDSIEEESSKQKNTFIIEDFPPKYPYREPSEALTEVASYVPPKKGTYFYSQMLIEALAYYDSNEIDNADPALTENLEKPYNVYHVVIKLFSDREEDGNVVYGEMELNKDSEALLAKEYERLSEQGYDVSLSEDYELKGLFTKSELETFDAFPEYGYIFSLVSE